MSLILDDILLAPGNLVVWIGEKVKEAAEAELYDESKLKKELYELQAELEMDEMTEEDYLKEEKEIMERLNYIRKMKEGAA
ncbi:MAG: gas vesicle protein GvpG [Chloroflexi bacterium]|nr:gas vesicle protein GvpG [Chloroflexota bacterium]